MGEQLSDSNLESSLSPSYVPTALLHTTHPAHGKPGTHWRPQTQRPSSCTKAKGFFSLLGWDSIRWNQLRLLQSYSSSSNRQAVGVEILIS